MERRNTNTKYIYLMKIKMATLEEVCKLSRVIQLNL